MIYCIGSSQVNLFTGVDKIPPEWPLKSYDILPWFKTFHIGPVTAYKAKKHFVKLRHILNADRKYRIGKDFVIPVMGSVDLRMHVFRQAKLQNKSVEEIVDNVANRYLANIQLLIHEGHRLVLYGCVCASVKAKSDEFRPRYGTVAERNYATKLFNRRLHDFCVRRRIRYLSVLEAAVFKNGMSDIRYMDTDFMGEGNGLHLTTKMLPLLLWKCRDIGLIPFDAAFLPMEAGNYSFGG